MAIEIRCGSCGSGELTDEFKIGASGYGIRVDVPQTDGGFLDRPYPVNACARICTRCGFIGMYAKREHRDALREDPERFKLRR